MIWLPQKTRNPECLHVESMAIISSVIFPLERTILSTLCRKMASSFFNSKGVAMPVSAAIVGIVREIDAKQRKPLPDTIEVALRHAGV